MSWLQMHDYQTFKVTSVDPAKRSFFECKDSKSDSGHSLLVHVAATHDSIVNGNRRFYRSDKMQEGISSWLPQYTKDGTCLRTPRPVLLGHDEKGSVLGRVLTAKYVDTSWQYVDRYPVIKDFLFYQRDGKKRHNLFNSINWIVDNLMPLKDYTGLGYTDLGLRITNPDAVRKVLADEYLTVSVGFKTDSAICSACHTDWADSAGKCEHKLGEIVDGKPVFLITGVIDNQELSFINFAADPFATTLSKKVLTDSLEKMFFLGLPIDKQTAVSGLSMKDGLFESDLVATEETMQQTIDATEQGLNAILDEIKSDNLTQDRALDLKIALGAWLPETDDLKASQRTITSTLNAKIARNAWDKAPETDAELKSELDAFIDETDAKKKKPESPEEEEGDGLEPGPSGMSGLNKNTKKITKKAAEKTKKVQHSETNSAEDTAVIIDWANWEDSASDIDKEYLLDVDGVNQELEDEIDAAISAGELPTDAKKLSVDEIANLDAEVFCGPGKSFPVPDAAHVVAARRLVGRIKLSDSIKTKILDAISNRATELNYVPFIKTEDTKVNVDTKDAAKIEALVDRMLNEADELKGKDPISQEERSLLVETVNTLDKAYDRLSAKGDVAAYELRWLLRALMTDWDADDEVRWAKKALAGKDHVVLTTAEAAEKDDLVNTLTIEKDSLNAKIVSLQDARQSVLNASKRTLAQQIVMYGVMTGSEIYKSLNQDQLGAKIEELSKRTITSLKDTVQDILSGIQWIKQNDSSTQADEPGKKMNDNAQITEAEAEPSKDTNITDAQRESEAIKARDALEIKLRYMSVPERNRFLASLTFQASASSK